MRRFKIGTTYYNFPMENKGSKQQNTMDGVVVNKDYLSPNFFHNF